MLKVVLVMILLMTVAATVRVRQELERKDPVYQPTLDDRKIEAQSLQTLSDYVGFEAKFRVAGPDGKTLVMEGSDLCGVDIPETLPGKAWQGVPRVGFTRFECSNGKTSAAFEVKPESN
jgi:hypothetical protein